MNHEKYIRKNITITFPNILINYSPKLREIKAFELAVNLL